MANNTEYQSVIEKLHLEPHPKGGYYRRLFGNDDTGKFPQYSELIERMC